MINGVRKGYNMKKRRLEWEDIKQIVEFKTFYLTLIFIFVGCIFLLLGYIAPDRFGQVASEIFTALGITFLTSSTVSIISEVFMKIDIVDFMSQKMLSVMPEEIKSDVGIKKFYADRKNIDFKDFWKKATGNIKIIGVSSNDVLSSANFPLIKQRLIENKGISIQVLLLSPWSFTAITRSYAKGYQTKYEGIIKTHAVLRDIQEFNDSWSNKGYGEPRIQLRLYDDIPSLSMVIGPEYAIVAPFMVIEIGGSSPYYIAEKNEFHSSLYDAYVEHFDTVWGSAIPVDIHSDINEIYQKQHNKDLLTLQNIPENYDKWLLSINHIERKNNVEY